MGTPHPNPSARGSFLAQSSSASRVTAGGLEFGNGPLALGGFLARNFDQRFAVEHHLVIDRANAR